MGATNSKEEVIIAQAGNNGSNDVKFSACEILGVIAFALTIIFIVWFCCMQYKKRLVKKISNRLSQSTIQVQQKI